METGFRDDPRPPLPPPLEARPSSSSSAAPRSSASGSATGIPAASWLRQPPLKTPGGAATAAKLAEAISEVWLTSDAGCLEADGDRDNPYRWIQDGDGNRQRELRQEGAAMTLAATRLRGYTLKGNKVALTGLEELVARTRLVRARDVLPTAAEVDAHADSQGAREGLPASGCVWRRYVAGKAIEVAVERATRMQVCLVSSACAYKPGGGFLEGGQHELEENLCMQSTLYSSLLAAEEQARLKLLGLPRDARERVASSGQPWRCFIPEDGAVLSPGVELFRGPASKGYPFEGKTTSLVAVVSVAMPNCNPQARDAPFERPQTDAEYRALLRQKFAAVLGAARMAGAEALVLPDVGCGTSRLNPAAEVGSAFGEVFRQHFSSAFREIDLVGPEGFCTAAETAGTSASPSGLGGSLVPATPSLPVPGRSVPAGASASLGNGLSEVPREGPGPSAGRPPGQAVGGGWPPPGSPGGLPEAVSGLGGMGPRLSSMDGGMSHPEDPWASQTSMGRFGALDLRSLPRAVPVHAVPYREPLLLEPQLKQVQFLDPRSGKANDALAGVIAFSRGESLEPWDRQCRAGFLGNHFDVGRPGFRLHVPGKSWWALCTCCQEALYFRNAEAAFQSLKFWNLGRSHEFTDLTGTQARDLSNHLAQWEDRSFAGLSNTFQAMLHVLRAKFCRGSDVSAGLLKTGSDFLLHHGTYKGEDAVWSDNFDGSGFNWLGMQLMLIREELQSHRDDGHHSGEWTSFIEQCIDTRIGAPCSPEAARRWQDAVQGAALAVRKATVPVAQQTAIVAAGPGLDPILNFCESFNCSSHGKRRSARCATQ